MFRTLTAALLVLSTLGVATGGLLRPCDCTPDEMQAPALGCCDQAAPRPVTPSCCRFTPAKDAAGDAPEGGEGEGCSICCKPRPPLGEVQAAVQVAPHALHQALLAVELPSLGSEPLDGTQAASAVERRTVDPWPLSPEGLTVFLI